ncbi:hypothetical protein BDZ89DRAFT_473668 [Hymenopellis radicata]|nr:hypothetical protein BDZ89DRAFT_473668 [Hymenopellis radicata]
MTCQVVMTRGVDELRSTNARSTRSPAMRKQRTVPLHDKATATTTRQRCSTSKAHDGGAGGRRESRNEGKGIEAPSFIGQTAWPAQTAPNSLPCSHQRMIERYCPKKSAEISTGSSLFLGVSVSRMRVRRVVSSAVEVFGCAITRGWHFKHRNRPRNACSTRSCPFQIWAIVRASPCSWNAVLLFFHFQNKD